MLTLVIYTHYLASQYRSCSVDLLSTLHFMMLVLVLYKGYSKQIKIIKDYNWLKLNPK